MSLDVSLRKRVRVDVYSRNITNNLGKMADAAGIYAHLWRPEELGIKYAKGLIRPLTAGLVRMKKNPARYKRINPSNGWGDYDGLIAFVTEYLAACKEHPNARIEVSR